MRFLITGAGGFVAPYLRKALQAEFGRDVAVVATSKYGGTHPSFGDVIRLDISHQPDVDAVMEQYKPTHVFNLAGIAAPTASARDPDAAWRVHLRGPLTIADAILKHVPEAWLLNIGTGMVYGATALQVDRLDETAMLAPIDEYATTKAAADLALGAMVWRGLKCIRLRPFNHIGAGQSEAFAVPSFAMQIARIEAGLAPPVLSVGNLDTERDILDVRDVATAYARVAAETGQMAPGTILNVASGKSRGMGDLLDQLLQLSPAEIKVGQDPARMRRSDLPRIVGDCSRAKALLDWEPRWSLEQTLRSVMDHCRAQLK